MIKHLRILVIILMVSSVQLSASDDETYTIANKSKDKIVHIKGTGDHQCVNHPPRKTQTIKPGDAPLDIRVSYKTGFDCFESKYMHFNIWTTKDNQTVYSGDLRVDPDGVSVKPTLPAEITVSHN